VSLSGYILSFSGVHSSPKRSIASRIKRALASCAPASSLVTRGFLGPQGLGNEWNNFMDKRSGRQAAIAFAAILLSAISAPAVVRVSDPFKFSFNDPNLTARARGNFGRDGEFEIAGGVVFQGQAQFYLEDGNTGKSISASSLTLNAEADGTVSLKYKGKSYKLEIHKGLACPLGKFIIRHGEIAYTIPARDDEPAQARMTRAGLVDQKKSVGLFDRLDGDKDLSHRDAEILEKMILPPGAHDSPHDSPHFQMAPKVSAKSGSSASIVANRSIKGSNRNSGMGTNS
jgi:hypothetical protein